MTWRLLCHRSEVAQPGDYVVIGDRAAVNIEGTVYVTDNICPHRGARVLSGNCGNGPHVCPYHGLSGVEAIGTRFSRDWVGDWLIAWDGEPQPFTEDDHLIFGRLSDWGDRIDSRYSWDTLPMSCNLQVAIENTLESVHVGYVHRDTFGKIELEEETPRRNGRHSQGFFCIKDQMTLRAHHAMAKNFPMSIPGRYWHLFLYPNVCLSSAGGFTYSLQHYVSIGNFTILHTRLYKGKLAAGAPDYSWFWSEAREFNMRVFQQDAQICAGVSGIGTQLWENEKRIEWYREELQNEQF